AGPADALVERDPVERDERTDAGLGGDQLAALQLGQGAADGAAADLVRRRELVLTRQPLAAGEPAGADPLGQVFDEPRPLAEPHLSRHVQTCTPRGDCCPGVGRQTWPASSRASRTATIFAAASRTSVSGSESATM